MTTLTEEDVKYARNLELCKVATRGEWAIAKRIFDEDPDALTAAIANFQFTVLHVAASSNQNVFFLQKLVDLMVQLGKPLGPRDSSDKTPLHFACQAGNTQIAILLVEADPSLITLCDHYNRLPIHFAAENQQEETTKYLLSVTLPEQRSLLFGVRGVNLLISLIVAGFYDLAIRVLEEIPQLSVEHLGIGGPTALLTLANYPQAFQIGIRLTFWQDFLYHVWERVYTNKSDSPQEKDVEVHKLSSIWKRLPPFKLFNKVRDEELRREKVLKLMRSLVDNASRSKQAADIFWPASRKAAECGILELVEEVLEAYPLIVYFGTRRNIFETAVIHRQENIFNLIFQMGAWKNSIMADSYSCNLLHHAGALLPTAKINQIPGAALQMQRELQWYIAVENVVQPSYKLAMNKDNKTPEMLFAESHQELVKEGGKWMKSTASSYTIVAALVVTMTFAAAFTAPGGIHDDTGAPVFLNDPSFMILAIADAFALFSSTTSLLMFLGILTSRYSQKDFLKTLPMKLAIGLIALFFSIGSMLVAFTASIHVMLFQRVSWIVVPIGLLACLPLLLFAFLQFPLLLELLYSTFGPSIFGKQSDKLLV